MAIKVETVSPAPVTPQLRLAHYRARVIARYKLRQRSGRPEELESPSDPRVAISFGYGCQQVRLRLMIEREWLTTADFPLDRPQLVRMFMILDPFFGYSPALGEVPHIALLDSTTQQEGNTK